MPIMALARFSPVGQDIELSGLVTYSQHYPSHMQATALSVMDQQHLGFVILGIGAVLGLLSAMYYVARIR